MSKKRTWISDALWLLACLGLLTATALYVAGRTGTDFFAHGPFDSYTRQALAWRDGRMMLDGEYPWLELAIFEGEYYVSFPPVPSVPMWVLSFFFGLETPDALMCLLYWLGGAAAAFFLARRYLPAAHAAGLAAFAALAGSLLDLAVSDAQTAGGVWYQAQLLAFLLTMLAFCLCTGSRRAGWAAGLVCIALAVGCRPLNALYVPLLLWILYTHVRADSLWRSVRAMLPYVAAPLAIAFAYGAYNYARFGNPFEFGHSFLPEYTESGDAVFALSNVWNNFLNILRPPQVVDGALTFPTLCGFAFYLTNPLVVLSPVRAAERALRRRGDAIDGMLAATLLLHALLLLTHRTFGGWQYGTRYLSDMVPALVFLWARGGDRTRPWEAFLMGALSAFSLYGTIVFHFL